MSPAMYTFMRNVANGSPEEREDWNMATNDARRPNIDRWLSWRRGVSVAPAGTRMFRVRSLEGEAIIGLAEEQLASMHVTMTTQHTPGDLMRRFERIGFLTVWQYASRSNDHGAWIAEAPHRMPLRPHSTLRIEHFDSEATMDDLAIAA